MPNLQEAFAVAEIFQSAKPSSLKKLASCGMLKSVNKGDHIFRDKEVVNTLYIIINGMVTLYKNNSIGEKKVIFVYGRGKTVNEVIINGLPASINCEVLSHALVLCFPINQFIEVMEQDFGLSKAIMESMSIKIRRMYRQLKNSSTSIHIDKKIAAKLYKLSMDYGSPCYDGIRIDIDLTITYLADMLGSKRETVSRQLKILSDAGMVVFKENRFIIPDCEKLREYYKRP